eukprot:2668161-Pyramimonas_sp.AAC.1
MSAEVTSSPCQVYVAAFGRAVHRLFGSLAPRRAVHRPIYLGIHGIVDTCHTAKNFCCSVVSGGSTSRFTCIDLVY